MSPSFSIETKTGSGAFLSSGFDVAGGSSTGTVTVESGAAIMKMISSTSITSTNGVTFISEFVG